MLSKYEGIYLKIFKQEGELTIYLKIFKQEGELTSSIII